MNLKTGIIFMIDVFLVTYSRWQQLLGLPFCYFIIIIFFILTFFSHCFLVMNHSALIIKLPTYDV